MSIGIDTSSLVTASAAAGTTQTGQAQNGFRVFSQLDLSDEQKQKLRAIFKNARSNNLSPTDLQSQINGILTPEQQQKLASFQTASATAGTAAGSATGSAASDVSNAPPGPFAGLKLTSAQSQKITDILAQAKTTSPDSIKSQIDAVLTTTQKQELSQGLAANSADINQIQNQIRAADSLNAQQRQAELQGGGTSSGSTDGTSATANAPVRGPHHRRHTDSGGTGTSIDASSAPDATILSLLDSITSAATSASSSTAATGVSGTTAATSTSGTYTTSLLGSSTATSSASGTTNSSTTSELTNSQELFNALTLELQNITNAAGNVDSSALTNLATNLSNTNLVTT